MTRINTNVGSLVAQNRLQRSNTDLNQALTRLSTGLRINKGSDDPAGLIASEALRSEITGLGKAISNTNRASQIISTADSALGEVSNLLNDIRGLVVEAANEGALSDEEIAANQLQIDSSLEAINRIAQTTTFQGRKLLDGSLDFTSTAGSIASLKDANIDQANLGATGSVNVAVDIKTAATQAETVISGDAFADTDSAATVDLTDGTRTLQISAANDGAELNGVTVQFTDSAGAGAPAATYDADTKVISVTYDSTGAADTFDYEDIATAIDGLAEFDSTATAGGTDDFDDTALTNGGDALSGGALADTITADTVFQLNGASGAETFNFAAGSTGDQIAAAVNLVSDATGVKATYTNADGLTLTSTEYGSDAVIGVDIINEEAGGTFESSLSSANTRGSDIVATVNGVEANGDANTLSINTATLDLSLTVDDGSTTDFNFNISGGGAKFQLGPDVVSNQQARLGIGSVSTGKLGGAAGRLYELGSGQDKSLTSDVSGASEIVTQVIDKVTSLRGRLGAFQSTTLDSNLNSLNETRANLLEAESSIRDADFAAESAALTRAQILVQSGTNVLSLANQQPQNVLALIR